MISKEWYVADFETTDYKYYEEKGFTKVWLYAVCDKEANITKIGNSIEDFMKYIRTLYGKTIYFHNLKFDGQFILDYLLKNGFTYYEDLKDVNKGFTTLIGEMGEFYSLTIKFGSHHQVHIYDSLKLLPFKVKKIAKDFGLPIEKEIIDYSNYEITPQAIHYVCNDVKIIAMALSKIKEQGMDKMTTASCAYKQFTSMKSEDFLYGAFPELSSEWLTEWRNAYRGGRSQVNPIYQGSIVKNVKRYDINSMYPHIMRNMQLPYGEPIKCDKPGKYNFELYKVSIEFSLKEMHLPSLLKKSGLYANEDSYYIESDGIEILWLSNIDFELLKRNYDITFLEYLEVWGFRTSSLMFFDYVDKWYAKKQIDKGAPKIVDKLMLNSLYGKFGSNHKGYQKIPVLDEVTWIVRFIKSEEQDKKHYYLPIAIAITSYAHLLLDNAIHETGILNFVYCDTDSIHTLGELPKSWIDNIALGKFKLEGIEEKAKYVRQKCYVHKDNEEITITCAGMTDDMKEHAIEIYGDKIFTVFKEGFIMKGKLLPKRVKGGIVLYETTFEIK